MYSSHTISAFFRVLLLSFALFFIAVGCSDDGNNTPAADNGFQAGINDFQDFANWEIVDYEVFPTFSNKLGQAHNGNLPEFARIVHKNGNTSESNGEYARGSIILKETFSWDNGQMVHTETGVLGMAKRGGDFESDKGGWEYFNLGSDGASIVARGGGSDMTGCNGCHSGATAEFGMDWVFGHPSEYVVPEGGEFDIFRDFAAWEMIDSRDGIDPLLSDMAHGVMDTTTRDVYRWQPAAMYHEGRFPVGTVLAKEVYKMVDGEKTYVTPNNGVEGDAALTVMVKRGGDFNPANGNWEWFMLNPQTETVLARGGAPLGCNGCHAGAASNNGGDYVFAHDGLGFSNP